MLHQVDDGCFLQMHTQTSAPVESTSRENASSASASQPALSVRSSTIEPATPPPTAKGMSAVHLHHNLYY